MKKIDKKAIMAAIVLSISYPMALAQNKIATQQSTNNDVIDKTKGLHIKKNRIPMSPFGHFCRLT